METGCLPTHARTKLLVVADDLTGATDAAVQFARGGSAASVCIWPDVFTKLESKAAIDRAVMVVNSETRHALPDQAAATVARIISMGRESGFNTFFKKTDSTLRGNVGAELEAALRASGERSLPFVAASPALGRTTREGVQYVHSIPLSETEYAVDPRNPIRSSDIGTILRGQCGVSVGQSSDATGDGARIQLFDCETVAELGKIARRLAARGPVKIAAGPAAFAGALSKVWDLPTNALQPIHFQTPILFVNGSVNPVALAQMKRLKSHRLKLKPEQFFGSIETLQGIVRSRCEMLAESDNLLLLTLETAEELGSYAAGNYGTGDVHSLVAARLGSAVSAALATGRFRTVAVIGGDTLAGVSRECGWAMFDAVGEPLTGVAAVRERQSGLMILTKPGGFGPPDVLAQLLKLAG